MAEIDNDLIRRLGNAILRQNQILEKLDGRLDEQGKVLISVDKQLAIVSLKLDEARDDIEDLTPPLGTQLPQSVPQPIEREQSWRQQLGGAVLLARKIWPVIKWGLAYVSAAAGGAAAWWYGRTK